MCRPIAFLLTGGQVADCTAGNLLLEQMLDAPILNGDKGYGSDAIRRQVEERGAMANIPPKSNRRWKNYAKKIELQPFWRPGDEQLKVLVEDEAAYVLLTKELNLMK